MRVLIVLPFPLLSEGAAAANCAIGTARGSERARRASTGSCSADARSRREPGPPADLPVEVVPVDARGRWGARWERFVRPHSWPSRPPFFERVRALSQEADVVHLVGVVAGGAAGMLDRPTVVQLDCSTRRDDREWNPIHYEGQASIGLLRAERRACRRSS